LTNLTLSKGEHTLKKASPNMLVKLTHRDILVEATSSQKVRATKVSSGNQGGELSVIDSSVTEFEMKLKFFK